MLLNLSNKTMAPHLAGSYLLKAHLWTLNLIRSFKRQTQSSYHHHYSITCIHATSNHENKHKVRVFRTM